MRGDMKGRVPMRWLLCLIVLGSLAGCGGDSSDEPVSAEDALVDVLHQVQQGQFGRAWDALHPAHQALVSRDQFVACEEDGPPAFAEIDVQDTFTEPYTSQGIGTVDASAVTVELGVGLFAPFVRTFHLVAVDGTWRWLLTDEQLATYDHGETMTEGDRCPHLWPDV